MSQDEQATLDWVKHSDEILHLFISQNKTLSEVIAHMAEKHNFKATARQYKSRFPKLKNVKAEEWIWIDQEIQRRAALGKKSEPILHKRPLPPDRVIREIARHKRRAHPGSPWSPVPNPSPGRISVRTPPPITTIISEPSLNPLDHLTGNHVESYTYHTYVEAQSTQQSTIGMAFAQEQVDGLHNAMAFESEIEADPFDLDLLNGFDFRYSDIDVVNLFSPATITKQNPSFVVTGSPRLQSGGRQLSPIFRVINFDSWETLPGFQIMTDLPWFKLQSMLEQPEYISQQLHPVLDGILFSPTRDSSSLQPEMRGEALSNLLDLPSELQLTENISQATSKLQRLVPERYEGELSDKCGQIFNARSTGSFNLSPLFGLAAYFASNNMLGSDRMDVFLNWVIEQKYTKHLERFLQINTPTIHSFTAQILKSAIRIKNIKFLAALMDHGVKFDSVLCEIFSIGDIGFMKLVLSKVNPTCFKEATGITLFHTFVRGNHFDLAQTLVEKGVSVDGRMHNLTSLYTAVSRTNIPAVKFLIDLGTDINSVSYRITPNTALGCAVYMKNLEIASLLVKHGANTSCNVGGKSLLEWSSLNCRNIYRLLKDTVGSVALGVTIGDLVDAANQVGSSLQAYISRHEGLVAQGQLEEALSESIRLGYLAATVALLQHGVSPDCYTLDTRPLWTALDSKYLYREFCGVLIKFKADANVPGILTKIVNKTDDTKFLQMFLAAGLNLDEQGMKALVESSECKKPIFAAFLLDSGVDVNTPGLQMNPLQSAVQNGNLYMVEFFLTRGADINAPAYPYRGRTALQSACDSDDTKVARFLLERGADIYAPPALVGGVTTLEAVCCNFLDFRSEDWKDFANRLLDANVPVNKPMGEPSFVLHSAIGNFWDDIVARILEPQRNAIINYMWCIEEEAEDVNEYSYRELRTPTQLAAEWGRLEAVKMLLGHGADINEAPAYSFGRTALQAAMGAANPDMELVQFLLDQGADVNAKPAVEGGITALQGAAISGDIMLAKLLLDRGADVNAAPSFLKGRYAIEGAAEHGRLDMVQLLLNAGALGNVSRGTGFKFAIALANENEHFVIAYLLENR